MGLLWTFLAPVLALAAGILQGVHAATPTAWRFGRATYFGRDGWPITAGSCGYGNIYQDEPLGWNVAAIPDVDPSYVDSCGRCFEVSCTPTSSLKDNYGATFDRSTACFDSTASVVVRVTDTCPCSFPSNPYSNKRWCCGDVPHIDMSVWAWERLADKRYGVIGIIYRPVPCDYQPDHLAPPVDNPTPAPILRPGKRVARDWPEFYPNTVNSVPIYQGGLLSGWTDSSIRFDRQASGPTGLQALEGSGTPLCGSLASKGSINLGSPAGVFTNRIKLVLWVYAGVDGANHNASEATVAGLTVILGGPQGDCQPVRLLDVRTTGWKPSCTECNTYWWRYQIYLGAFAGAARGPYGGSIPQMFSGCGGMEASALTYLRVDNPQPELKHVCIDHISLE